MNQYFLNGYFDEMTKTSARKASEKSRQVLEKAERELEEIQRKWQRRMKWITPILGGVTLGSIAYSLYKEPERQKKKKRKYR